MEIKRTANAGVLLTLDGLRVLLDGVSREILPYLPTPEEVRKELLRTAPDVLCFTHQHADHYDAAFVSEYLQNAAGPILGPADIPFCRQETMQIQGLRISQIPSRHIGKQEPVGHVSFIIEGSKCVWFMGDASPLQWRDRTDLPKPDILIAPYAYATGSGWQISQSLGADAIVLLHLPERKKDIYSLWDTVESTVGQEGMRHLLIPEIGQIVNL